VRLVAEPIRLLGLRQEPLRLDEVYAALGDASAGGSCVFVGAVRDHDQGRPVTRLDYEAHPSAEQRLCDVAAAVAAAYPVEALVLVHRVGSLAVGDLAVVAGVACAHRDEAFGACRRLIDDTKAGVPIWKRQVFADGAQEWVGTP
jgi:molybdopterin synthase catalytic subunit